VVLLRLGSPLAQHVTSLSKHWSIPSHLLCPNFCATNLVGFDLPLEQCDEEVEEVEEVEAKQRQVPKAFGHCVYASIPSAHPAVDR